MLMKRLLSGLLATTILVTSTAFAADWKDYNPALKEGWEVYRHNFIQADDGRVIDHRIGISTSEGQSYAMLRAVWMRDKEWFDKTYQWAVDNLQVRAKDKLFAWKWGERHDKTWGPLDDTAASDADQDIALALLLAAEIWEDTPDGKRYKEEARAILNDIWDYETMPSPLGRVMLPGDWNIDQRDVQINPSYFSPLHYRVFDEVDRKHQWKELIKSSYTITQKAVELTPTHLPPDWVQLNMQDGSIALYKPADDIRSDYGYEAIRVYWRFALDYFVTGEPQAKTIMAASDYLPRFWKIRGDLPGTVTYDGIQRDPKIVSGAVYGAPLAALGIQDNAMAEDLVTKQVVPNLKPGAPWNTQNDYYTQNWLWLGLALYQAEQKNIDYPRKLDTLERVIWLMNYEE